MMNPENPMPAKFYDAAQGNESQMESVKRGPKTGPRLSKSQRLEQLLQQKLDEAKALEQDLKKAKKEDAQELHAANLKVIKDAGLLDLDTDQWHSKIERVKAIFAWNRSALIGNAAYE